LNYSPECEITVETDKQATNLNVLIKIIILMYMIIIDYWKYS